MSAKDLPDERVKDLERRLASKRKEIKTTPWGSKKRARLAFLAMLLARELERLTPVKRRGRPRASKKARNP